MVGGKLVLLVARAVNNIVLGGERAHIDAFDKEFDNLFKLGTITYRLLTLPFYSLGIAQYDDYFFKMHEDENLKSCNRICYREFLVVMLTRR